MLQSELFRDADNIEGLCRQLFHIGLNAVLVIAVAVGISLWVQPWMTLYFAVPVGIGLLQLFHHQLQKHFAAYRQESEQMNARMGEMLGMLALNRAHGLEQEETRQVRSLLHRLRKAGLRLDVVNELFAASSYMCFNLLMLLGPGFVAWLVLSDRLTIGQAVMFHTSFGMLVARSWTCSPALAQGVDSFRSLGELMETTEIEVSAGRPRHRCAASFHLFLPERSGGGGRRNRSSCVCRRDDRHCRRVGRGSIHAVVVAPLISPSGSKPPHRGWAGSRNPRSAGRSSADWRGAADHCALLRLHPR